jgi:cytochrome c oxidase subunit 2
MIGWVVAMEPADYQTWLAGVPQGGGAQTMASAGRTLFEQLGCETCHRADSGSRGPDLVGLFGRDVHLADGKTVVADEGYLRESILDPQAKVVAGYQPIMPTFKGLVTEDSLLQLIAFIRSLSGAAAGGATPADQATYVPAAAESFARRN